MAFNKLGLVLIILVVVAAVSYVFLYEYVPVEVIGIESFSSEQEFKSYLQESTGLYGWGYFGGAFMGTAMIGEAAPAAAVEKTVAVPERVSTTTVQVVGIDEPDIVKTDGNEIYFSSYGYRGYWWGLEAVPYYRPSGEIKVVKSFPPEDLNVETKINRTGDLLLYNNTLIIFSGNKIYGQDVSNPESPQELWTIDMNSSMVGARLYNGKIYLITRKAIDPYHPCPIRPLSKDGVAVVIECTRIYHPTTYIPIDVTYNAIVLNPSSGEVEKTVSFVGSSGSSIVYMSENAIYITYSYFGDFFEIYSDFLKEKCTDLIPSQVIARIENVKNYNISTQAKLVEFGVILEEYMSTLSSDERMRVTNEMMNRMMDYFEEHKRDFMRTGIAKIGLDMEVLGTGTVPGTPLNQFSLDEYQNHLRIATTVGGWFWAGNTTNDVYVLDSDLKTVGSVKDLGVTERIYSVRFIQDKGYVVTFRQVDPFYVLDLSTPTSPQLKGELKIPGYSSYLHPITKDKILGMGKEGSYVKVSLFDVSSAELPQEVDKYSLSEYWSDVLVTHHAFLLDDEHEIFFMPGSQGGYIFSYENDELSLVKTVSMASAERAVYIEDYLYIVGEDKIVVLDEISWEKVKEIEFSS